MKLQAKVLPEKYRMVLTVLLALGGIGLMVFYEVCDTACSYLIGDMFGIDLKWVGIAYMLALMLLALFRLLPWLRALLAAGLGVEAYLVVFQIQNEVYCPFCLVFALLVIAAYSVNYEVPSAWLENRRRMWLYFLGEVDLKMMNAKKVPLIVFALTGYLFTVFSFSGAVTPAYGKEHTGIPSLGKGSYEILLFSDYFCPPCRKLDTAIEPALKALLEHGNVKITFIDVPFADATPLYARYYLYAIRAGATGEEVLRIRGTLFQAAQDKKILSRDPLLQHLQAQNIVWKEYDVQPVFQKLNQIIRQYRVTSTPTCIIKSATSRDRKFIGSDEIETGLLKFKSDLGVKVGKATP